MTRFVLTVDEAVQLVLDTLTMDKKTLHIPTLPAMRIVDLAKAFDADAIIEEIGAFPGEKLHESLSETQTSDKARRMTVAEIKRLIDATI